MYILYFESGLMIEAKRSEKPESSPVSIVSFAFSFFMWTDKICIFFAISFWIYLNSCMRCQKCSRTAAFFNLNLSNYKMKPAHFSKIFCFEWISKVTYALRYKIHSKIAIGCGSTEKNMQTHKHLFTNRSFCRMKWTKERRDEIKSLRRHFIPASNVKRTNRHTNSNMA